MSSSLITIQNVFLHTIIKWLIRVFVSNIPIEFSQPYWHLWQDHPEKEKEKEAKEGVSLSLYWPFFRELDIEVMNVLQCGLLSRSILDTELHSKVSITSTQSFLFFSASTWIFANTSLQWVNNIITLWFPKSVCDLCVRVFSTLITPNPGHQ